MMHTIALMTLLATAQQRADQELRPWTILVYGAADNNADGPILFFLDSVRKAIDDDPGIELLLFLDRHEKFSDDAEMLGEDFAGTRLYRLRRDSAERLSGAAELPEITLGEDVELDSADPDNIGRFIAWGKAHYPARRTGLLIYSHADGQTMCPDEESGRDSGIAELTDLVGGDRSVDFLALELCNMGGIEIAYQWRPGTGRFGADVLVAIPNAGPPLDWDRAFARIRSSGHESAAARPFLEPTTMTAEDFGRLVVEEGYLGRKAMAARHGEEGGKHESAACYDLRVAAEVKRAVDELAVALAQGGEEARTIFQEMRGPGPIGDAINYTRGGPFVDLHDLCERAADCDALSDAVRGAASSAREAVDRFVVASFGMDGYADFQPGKDGVFIVMPEDQEGRWKHFGWYTPLPLEGGRQPYGRWAFLKDGATPANGKVENWFELLDSWYDDVSDAPEGLNGYRW